MDPSKAEGQQGTPSSPPAWITKEMFQEVLRNDRKENSLVEAIAVSLATAAGDNYASTIYRVKAALSDGKERSSIIKGPVHGAAISDVITESGTFKRETVMLADLIPQMEALLEEAAPGRFLSLAPRCLHHGTSPVEFIVMEDLGPPGFKMGDRQRGLGLRHSLLALRALAHYHAASHALLKRHPGEGKKLNFTWATMVDNLKMFVTTELQAAADACRSWPGFEEYADRLERFKLVATDKYKEINNPKTAIFNVITHGDFTVNNVMFRYDGGIPAECRPFDLQNSHVGSPAQDLVYFLGSSLSDNVHDHHLDLLLREYHFTLQDTLTLLGLQAPPFEWLLAELDQFGILSLLVVLARPVMKAEHGVDMNAVFSGDHSALTPLYNLPDVKKWTQRLLPDYARRGWLPA